MLWEFLSNADNQKTLSFIGGGVVVALSGLWTVFTVLRKSPEKPAKKPTPTQSSGDGLAAMGDVLIEGNVTITKTTMPKALYVLAAVGLGLIVLGFALPRCGDVTATGSVVACGDINAGDITIGLPSGDSQ